MRDLETRLAEALSSGAESAPTATAGLVDGARRRLRRGRVRRGGVVAAVVVLLVATSAAYLMNTTTYTVKSNVAPRVLADVTVAGVTVEVPRGCQVTDQPVDPPPGGACFVRVISGYQGVDRPSPVHALDGGGWAGEKDTGLARRVTVQAPDRETVDLILSSIAGPATWRTVRGASADLVFDVPVNCESIALPNSAGAGCVWQLSRSSSLDPGRAGVRRNGQRWTGSVSVDGRTLMVVAATRDDALRMLASLRPRGTAIPDLSGDWRRLTMSGYHVDLPVGLASPYGRMSHVPAFEPLGLGAMLEQDGPDNWIVGNVARVGVRVPTQALAELVVGQLQQQYDRRH